MIQRYLLCTALLLGGLSLTLGAAEGVKIKQLDDRLRVEIDGELFTEYYFKDVPKPFFYPVIGPDGAAMTRNFPMKDLEHETKDHPHHRSLYYGHGSVNGVDFWSEGANSGKTVHTGFLEIRDGARMGLIRSENQLVSKEGKVIGSDERTYRIIKRQDGSRMLDFDITHKATHGDLVFEDTKEGTMAIRVAETLVHYHHRSRANREGEGKMVSSEGVRNSEIWGKRAKWVDYYGPVDGKVVGIAMFDHPSNPRHPTWWHARDYGLFAANPFGVNDFERRSDPTAGNLKVPAGQSTTFRYRLYFHRGDEKEGRVEEVYNQYVSGGGRRR